MKIKQCKHRQVPGRQLRRHIEHSQPFLWLSFFSSANLSLMWARNCLWSKQNCSWCWKSLIKGTALNFSYRFNVLQLYIRASLVAQSVKNPPAMKETLVQFLSQEDSFEEGMATQSSILAWRNSMDRGAWWATVHGVTKSQTRLSH